MLYPLKFTPILKERIWGSDNLVKLYNKRGDASIPIGESWEISGVAGDVSVVSNGVLKGNTLEELIEIYMGDLVGDKVYDIFGLEFPILIKLLDAGDVLSVQVHPDDEIAKVKHNSQGKTEMWYIMDAQKDAEIYLGFNKSLDKITCKKHLENGTLTEVLGAVKVHKDDAFHIPSGMVHALGKGMILAEIQQTSDITYRLFDWNRVDAQGKGRELHIEDGLDAINFDLKEPIILPSFKRVGEHIQVNNTPYFSVNGLYFDKPLERDYLHLDSFVIFMVLEGECTLEYKSDKGKESLVCSKGESVLVPNILDKITLTPTNKGECKLLEVFLIA